MKALKVGIIGFGTVGTGVYKVLQDFPNIEIVKIAVKSLGKKRNIENFDENLLTDNAFEIANNPEIDVVIEVAGGVNPTFDVLKTAINNGKHIVTANKELLAKQGSELFKLAKEKNVIILYEAAVAGGIPIIMPIKTILCANKLNKIAAIVNGTTNYILTKMTEKELREIKNIESVVLKTKEQEKKEMMEESEIFESIMGDWDEDESPLKDSFLIKVTNLEEIKDTVTKIKKIDKVSVVNYGESMVEKLLSAFNVIEKVTVAVVIALVIVNIFLIINTIKLTIFSRKREISIMRLVGASNFSIKD